MLSQKLQQALKMFDQSAEREGISAYQVLEEELQQVRSDGDRSTEAELLQEMGIRLISIATIAKAYVEHEPDASLFPTPAETLEAAINLFYESLEVAESISDETHQKFVLSHLGNCYLQLNRFEEALQYFTSVLNLYHMPEDAVLCFDASQKAGDCHLNLENDEKALAYYHDALEVALNIDDPFEVSTQLGKIANALSNLKQYNEALSHYEQARDLLIRIGNEETLQKKILIHKNVFNVSALPGLIEYTNERISHTRERQCHSQAIEALPKASTIRYRHAYYYLEMLEAIDKDYKDASVDDRFPVIARFEQEWEQIRKGQDWAASSAIPYDIVVQLCIDYAFSAVSFLDARISVHERLKWNVDGLSAADQQHELQTQSRLLTNLGYNYSDLGQTGEAQEHLERALCISRESNDQSAEGNALIALSHIYNKTGRYAEALQTLKQGESLVSDPEAEEDSRYLANQVSIYLNTGAYAQAIKDGKRDLAAAREMQDVSREAKALGNIGLVYYSLGQYQTALEYHQRALTLARQLGELRGEMADLTNAGSAYMELEQFQQSQACYEDALNIARELNNRGSEEDCLGNLGNLYRMMGRYNDAIEQYREAQAIALKSQHRAGEAMALQGLGNVFLKRSEYDKAIAHYNKALVIEREISRPDYQSIILYSLGNAYTWKRQFDRAIKQYDQGLDVTTVLGNKHLEAKARLAKAATLQVAGRSEEALPEARLAHVLFEELGLTHDAEAAAITISNLTPAQDKASSPDAMKAEVFRLLYTWTEISAIDVTESKALLLEYKERLLTDEAENILHLLVRNKPDDQGLQRHVQLLRECRTDGVEAAYEKYSVEFLAFVSADFDRWKETPEAKRVIDTIVEWAQQPNKASSKRFIEANKDDLLTINSMLVIGLMSKDDQPDAYRFRKLRDLFDLCRKQGIDSAYADFEILAWHSDMVSLVLDWINHGVNGSVKDFLNKHQDCLLSDEAEFVLSEWLELTPNWGTEQFLRLIQRARKDGIDKAMCAFQLLEWMNTPNWDAKKQFMHEHADVLLTDEAEEVLQYIVKENPEQGEKVDVHRILLRACRRDNIDAGFDLQAYRITSEYAMHLSNQIIAWLASPSWEDSMSYLKENSEELLTEWALHITKKVARQIPDTEMIEMHLKLLETCLEVGIDRAYAMVREKWQNSKSC